MPSLPEQLSSYWVIVASAVFLAKQFCADFLLQSKWMALGKERTKGWAAPLGAHAGVHGAATAAIFAALAPPFIWMGAVDFVVHFAIDRAKAATGRALRLTAAQSSYWWLLGFDQSLHHATHLGFVVIIAAFHTAQ